MNPSLLSAYVGRRFVLALLLITGATALIIFFADYVEVLRRYSDDDNFTVGLGLELTGLRLPIIMDALLPFVVLFAAMLSLLALSRSLELVVARASGVSVWRFLAIPFAIAILFGAAATSILNPLAVEAKARADEVQAGWTDANRSGDAGYWFRQQSPAGSSIVHSNSVDRDGRVLTGVTAFTFGPDGKFQEKVTAARGDLQPGRWILTDAKSVSAADAPRNLPRLELPTELSAESVKRTVFRRADVSFWSLPGQIDLLDRTGRNSDPYVLAFHELMSRPLFFAAMVAIAATVSLRLTRYGRLWQLILTGVAAGFLLYVLSKIVRDLGANGILNPILAAWLPPIVALTFGATALLYQEDG